MTRVITPYETRNEGFDSLHPLSPSLCSGYSAAGSACAITASNKVSSEGRKRRTKVERSEHVGGFSLRFWPDWSLSEGNLLFVISPPGECRCGDFFCPWCLFIPHLV